MMPPIVEPSFAIVTENFTRRSVGIQPDTQKANPVTGDRDLLRQTLRTRVEANARGSVVNDLLVTVHFGERPWSPSHRPPCDHSSCFRVQRLRLLAAVPIDCRSLSSRVPSPDAPLRIRQPRNGPGRCRITRSCSDIVTTVFFEIASSEDLRVEAARRQSIL